MISLVPSCLGEQPSRIKIKLWLIAYGSLALSVKMSILLYLPAVAVILLKRRGLLRSLGYMCIVVAIQIGLGSRFLFAFPWEYLKCSFDFSRQFLYIWTVNWKMMSEEAFLSRHFTYSLLACHVSTLLVVGHYYWCRAEGGIWHTLFSALRHPRKHILAVPLTSEGTNTFFLDVEQQWFSSWLQMLWLGCSLAIWLGWHFLVLCTTSSILGMHTNYLILSPKPGQILP
jgi:hypothetical protein